MKIRLCVKRFRRRVKWSIPARYSLYPGAIPGVCSRDTRSIPAGYPEYAHGILAVSRRDTWSMSTGYSQYPRRIPGVCSRDTRSIPARYSYYPGAIPGVCSRDTRSIPPPIVDCQNTAKYARGDHQSAINGINNESKATKGGIYRKRGIFIPISVSHCCCPEGAQKCCRPKGAPC